MTDKEKANRTQQLIYLKGKYSLSNTDIAKICSVSIHTVNEWFRSPKEFKNVAISEPLLELLTIKLAMREANKGVSDG
ncbi:MAG: hypothetical protein CMC89_02835 [Flavobacteriaceae bacterium]|nr:hypothetical protein [Flavobacteriaceae bacterium]|tara:strand:+ start:5122 stop:5355 length:234 start_codon:yes stop_codon:yes gene_type:complete